MFPFRRIQGGPYQEVILGFFDILGFSNIVRTKCSENPDYLINIFQSIDSDAKALFAKNFETRIVSDSIVVWSNDISASILPIVNLAYLLQSTLLREGILIRGVITIGNHYSVKVEEMSPPIVPKSQFQHTNDEIIVSPVLVECVEKEKQLGAPIIVIESKLHEILETAFRSNSQFSRHTTTFEGMMIVDAYYTSHEFLAIQHKIHVAQTGPNSPDNQAKMHYEAAIKSIHSNREIVLCGLENFDDRIRKKWLFIARRFNEMLGISSQYFPEVLAAKIEID